MVKILLKKNRKVEKSDFWRKKQCLSSEKSISRHFSGMMYINLNFGLNEILKKGLGNKIDYVGIFSRKIEKN